MRGNREREKERRKIFDVNQRGVRAKWGKENKVGRRSHRVQICGQFFYGRLQVVHSFQTVLKETEEEEGEGEVLSPKCHFQELNYKNRFFRFTLNQSSLIKKCVCLTCTVRGSTWWGSAASLLPSWFWSRWLWGDTVNMWNTDPVNTVRPGSVRGKGSYQACELYSCSVSNIYTPFISFTSKSKSLSFK